VVDELEEGEEDEVGGLGLDHLQDLVDGLEVGQQGEGLLGLLHLQVHQRIDGQDQRDRQGSEGSGCQLLLIHALRLAADLHQHRKQPELEVDLLLHLPIQHLHVQHLPHRVRSLLALREHLLVHELEDVDQDLQAQVLLLVAGGPQAQERIRFLLEADLALRRKPLDVEAREFVLWRHLPWWGPTDGILQALEDSCQDLLFTKEDDVLLELLLLEGKGDAVQSQES